MCLNRLCGKLPESLLKGIGLVGNRFKEAWCHKVLRNAFIDNLLKAMWLHIVLIGALRDNRPNAYDFTKYSLFEGKRVSFRVTPTNAGS